MGKLTDRLQQFGKAYVEEGYNIQAAGRAIGLNTKNPNTAQAIYKRWVLAVKEKTGKEIDEYVGLDIKGAENACNAALKATKQSKIPSDNDGVETYEEIPDHSVRLNAVDKIFKVHGKYKADEAAGAINIHTKHLELNALLTRMGELEGRFKAKGNGNRKERTVNLSDPVPVSEELSQEQDANKDDGRGQQDGQNGHGREGSGVVGTGGASVQEDSDTQPGLGGECELPATARSSAGEDKGVLPERQAEGTG